MKIKAFTIIGLTALLLSGCGSNNTSQTTQSSSQSTSHSSSSSTSTEPKQVTVAAHTVKDTSSPIDITSMGQVVDETTWDSFKNGNASKFINNYNYTYTYYVSGSYGQEKFTKNGYKIMSSTGGSLYYERKSGSTFYQYSASSDGGYIRTETQLDIQSRYTSRIISEINVHMFEFSNYEYDDYDGTYRYYAESFAAHVKFQGGYLTYLYYSLGTNTFQIYLSFETKIQIPKSYYYA